MWWYRSWYYRCLSCGGIGGGGGGFRGSDRVVARHGKPLSILISLKNCQNQKCLRNDLGILLRLK